MTIRGNARPRCRRAGREGGPRLGRVRPWRASAPLPRGGRSPTTGATSSPPPGPPG